MPNERILKSPGQASAEARMLAADGSVREAFEGLALGFGFDDVAEYLQAVRLTVGLDVRQFGRFTGVCMAFAIVCVEQDRSRASRSLLEVLADVDGAVAALPEEERERYRKAQQSIIDARRFPSAAPAVQDEGPTKETR